MTEEFKAGGFIPRPHNVASYIQYDPPKGVFEFVDGTVVDARTAAYEWREWRQALELAMSTCIGAKWGGCTPGDLGPLTVYGRVVGVVCPKHAQRGDR